MLARNHFSALFHASWRQFCVDNLHLGSWISRQAKAYLLRLSPPVLYVDLCLIFLCHRPPTRGSLSPSGATHRRVSLRKPNLFNGLGVLFNNKLNELNLCGWVGPLFVFLLSLQQINCETFEGREIYTPQRLLGDEYRRRVAVQSEQLFVFLFPSLRVYDLIFCRSSHILRMRRGCATRFSVRQKGGKKEFRAKSDYKSTWVLLWEAQHAI